MTSADVARAAGVSRSTVSQVLNGKGGLFSESTRTLVITTAAELNYQPSAAARTLATGSSDFIIAVIPNTTFGGNLQDLFESATEEFAACGLTLVLRLASADPASLGRMLSGMKPRAILSLAPFSDAEREVIAENDVNLFDPPADALAEFDRYVGSVQAEHLHQKGHRRLGYAHLRDTRRDLYGGGREDGVRRYCTEQGLDEPAVVHVGLDQDDPARALDILGAPGMAVACYNDDVATALLAAAHRRQLRVPQDIAVMGMDDTPLAQFTIPRLTTVSYDVTTGGRILMSHVLAVLTGQEPTMPDTSIPLRVVQGETT